MPSPRKVIVTKQRTVHTYAEMWHASHCVLEAGLANPTGSAWQFLSSVVLTAFAFEAYLNHVGAATFACWSELERLPPQTKLTLLFEELHIQAPGGTGVRPLQTIERLLSFRNTIAHGRTSEIAAKALPRTTENYDDALHEPLRTDWEKLVQSPEFAQRAREDVKAVLALVHAGRRDEKEPLFTFGIGLHGATLANEP